MAKINLLPWREQLRKERQRQFMTVAIGGAVLALLVVVYIHLHIGGLIENQRDRNEFLKDRIAELDRKIKEIEKLESTKEKLLARMNIIEQLQRSRPEVVHLFDELSRTLPEGVYLGSMSQSGSNLTVKGKAQSNARVSGYMRNIDASEWLDNPSLDVIETKDESGLRISEFTLKMQQTTPDADSDEDQQAAANQTDGEDS